MKANEIRVGGIYIAKVNNKLQKVRVDRIDFSSLTDRKIYDVTNLATGRKTTFRSAAKFRSEFKPDVLSFAEKYGAEKGGVPDRSSTGSYQRVKEAFQRIGEGFDPSQYLITDAEFKPPFCYRCGCSRYVTRIFWFIQRDYCCTDSFRSGIIDNTPNITN